jgi:hypothetical protein
VRRWKRPLAVLRANRLQRRPRRRVLIGEPDLAHPAWPSRSGAKPTIAPFVNNRPWRDCANSEPRGSTFGHGDQLLSVGSRPDARTPARRSNVAGATQSSGQLAPPNDAPARKSQHARIDRSPGARVYRLHLSPRGRNAIDRASIWLGSCVMF